MSKVKDTRLVPRDYDLNWKELGGSLIEAAQEKQKRNAQDAAINRVSGIMTLIGKERMNIENSERRIKKYEEQLKAIENGDFRVTVEGTVILNDKQLDSPNL